MNPVRLELTVTEADVLLRKLRGCSNAQIADRLRVSATDAASHIENISLKLHRCKIDQLRTHGKGLPVAII